MLGHARILGQLAKTAARPGQARMMASYAVADYKQPTMDELPIPSGSWQAAHSAKQAKFNMYLGGSIAFFIVTCIVGYQVGTLNFLTGPSLKNEK